MPKAKTKSARGDFQSEEEYLHYRETVNRAKRKYESKRKSIYMDLKKRNKELESERAKWETLQSKNKELQNRVKESKHIIQYLEEEVLLAKVENNILRQNMEAVKTASKGTFRAEISTLRERCEAPETSRASSWKEEKVSLIRKTLEDGKMIKKRVEEMQVELQCYKDKEHTSNEGPSNESTLNTAGIPNETLDQYLNGWDPDDFLF